MKTFHHSGSNLRVALTRYTGNPYQAGTFIAIVLIAVLLGGHQAYASVLVKLSSSVASSNIDDTLINDSFAELGPAEPTGSGESGLGHARAAGLTASSLLQVTASTSIRNGTSLASMTARASWQDIIFIDGASAPDDIRLNFEIDGQLAVSTLNGGSLVVPDVSHAVLYILALDRHLGLDPPVARSFGPSAADGFKILVESIDTGSGTTHTAEAVAGGAQQWLTQSLTTNDLLNYDFHGTFEIVTPQRDLGGGINAYFAALGVTAVSANRDANSSSDFFGTIKLTSVTDADGSPLPNNVNVVFDSGLVIPEPSTAMILIPFCIITISGMARRRIA